MIAGARLVALGTGLFVKPDMILDVKRELIDYMERYHISQIEDIVGTLELNA